MVAPRNFLFVDYDRHVLAYPWGGYHACEFLCFFGVLAIKLVICLFEELLIKMEENLVRKLLLQELVVHGLVVPNIPKFVFFVTFSEIVLISKARVWSWWSFCDVWRCDRSFWWCIWSAILLFFWNVQTFLSVRRKVIQRIIIFLQSRPSLLTHSISIS